CFMAAWPVYGMLANHMRRTLKATYENNGWDLVDELRGTPITLDIFLNEAEMYSLKHIGYGTELSQDFTGAIIARAEDLCDADRAVIFNTTHDLPMSELMSKPTIIEMDGIGDPEFTCFSLSLILIRVIEHLKALGPTDKLRCLLVIDEAHRVLEEMAKPHDEHETASAKYKATEILVNLIAEARSYGLGIVLVEQIPTRLARNAIKNCHTKIVHKLTSPDDVELMAAETGCDKEQKAHITALKTGEAVIADPRSIVPANIQVFYDPDFYPEMKRSWTDDDVRERMKPFYETHPGFAKRPEIPVLMPHRIPLADASTIQIEDVIETPTFWKLWAEAVAIDEADSSNDRLAWLIASYACNLGPICGTPEQTAQVLLELATDEYGAPPNPPDMALIRQLIAEIRRRKPDGVRRGTHAP
ncbi:MAG: ATP-binding protein, partial [Candidatus Thorarchaeota archaeon]